MAADTIVAPPTQCDHCKRASSPKLKIRACTRCFSVGYCSKDCQRKEWKKHKLICKPRIDSKIEQQTSLPKAADQDVIDINSDSVRLETQCENGTWQDVGPIHLLNNMDSNNYSSSLRRKELSSGSSDFVVGAMQQQPEQCDRQSLVRHRLACDTSGLCDHASTAQYL